MSRHRNLRERAIRFTEQLLLTVAETAYTRAQAPTMEGLD
jgi:hypothetical protein